VTPGITPFGKTPTGDTVQRITISNGVLSASILTLGVILQDVRLAGVSHSLTIGSPDLSAYLGPMNSCGAIVGPVANRIGGAAAVIDGKTCHFDPNQDGKHTLHGGAGATHTQIWTLADHSKTHAEFHLHLPDAAHGFPGNRSLTARYDIHDATLRLTLTATTDATTLLNLANHSYWRLDDAATFAGQTLQIAADQYLPTTPDNLPTGKIVPLDSTRFDFRQPRNLTAGTEGLIDHNFCLSQTRQPLRPIAWLRGTSGLCMEMASTEPGLQVFDGHNLNMPDYASNDGPPHQPYAGLALEAQFWPDASNNADFPNIILRAGQPWQQITSWMFSQ